MLHDLEKFSLPEIEEKVLKFWKEHDIFKKLLARGKDKKIKPFRFFEGPPTANGRPGIHHVIGRSFKDVIPRYKSMRGFHVLRKAGWDTHGLPVEIAVEKELGIKKKDEIEKFGIAAFNAKAKESVWRYKAEWEKLTERIGFWLDFEHPYITYETPYIETLWWIFKEVHKRGLLKKLYKVVPWCPRCQTPLSSHELAQPGGYQKTKDPSVYVKFKIKGAKRKSGEYLLVWTTTPWTLPANMAVAVNPKLVYTKFKIGNDFVWSLNAPPNPRNESITVVEKMSGTRLIGLSYEPLYAMKKKKGAISIQYKVVRGDFVSAEEGTGFVHVAPAFGEDDLAVWQKEHPSLREAIFMTINDQGVMVPGFPGAGKFVKSADTDIVADLTSRGILYHVTTLEHDYPFCWRCSSPLLYSARSTWFILMSKLREELLARNNTVNWVPSHLKEGRFGEWLREVKDWAISRKRYWGTPLPIWECDRCDAKEVIGSMGELNKKLSHGNRYFFARHGEADHTLTNTIAGGNERKATASHLTANGKKQAEAMGKALKALKVHMIFASPYARTKETAKIIAAITKAKVIVDKRLGEIDCGIFNGQLSSTHKAFFSTPLEEFVKRPPEGENLNDVRVRVADFIKEIDEKYRGKRIVIVSHGDPLWVLKGVVQNFANGAIPQTLYPKVGTYEEVPFISLPRDAEGNSDLHRPFVDEATFSCSECKGVMRRIPEVADVWFDSGAMPYAQWHYPFENKEMIDEHLQFPADYISEAIDQTRGWFYTLLAIATLLGKEAPYRNVISYSHVLDKHGQKMSKSKGNVVDPWAMIEKYGADAVRWYFFTVSDPGEPKKFDEVELQKTLRSFVLILYNSFLFWDAYARQGIISLSIEGGKKSTHELDQWITARLDETILLVTKELEHYHVTAAARGITELVDDVTHWYIRRSRRRFSEKSPEAFSTLFSVLVGISKLIAPFTPFLGEALYQALRHRAPQFLEETSVHLASWPEVSPSRIDRKTLQAMAEVRRLARLGLAKRGEVRIKVRQPLRAMYVYGKYDVPLTHEALLKDEVNVKEIIRKPKSGDEEVGLDIEITPELREEGMIREIARLIQQLRQDAGLAMGDRIELHIYGAPLLRNMLAGGEKQLMSLVGAVRVTLGNLGEEGAHVFDARLDTKLEDASLTIAFKKAV